MKRLLGTLSRRGSQESTETNAANGAANGDSPEASVARGVKLFCESGGPNNSGEEVLHLPVIVDAAESSPAAAREAANRIRKFLSKENFPRAYVQYNAIMLVRILTDNPGKSFSRNLDTKFVTTVKELLREGRDASVQQILRETLESFETQKADDETLAPLREMWKKEKLKMGKVGSAVSVVDGLQAHGLKDPQLPQPVPRNLIAPAYNPNQQNYFARNHKPHGLPPPHELAQRIEEAKTSSKLLLQVVQSTPPTEIQGNELIQEFVERCQSASRSIQDYIHSDSPAPDEDTLLTLIETNDQISTALSRYQRALLQARRSTSATNVSPSPPVGQGGLFEAPGSFPPIAPPVQTSFSPPSGPPPRRQQSYLQDPFDERHESGKAAQPDALQAPLEHQAYGLPPSGYTTRHERPFDHDTVSPLEEPPSPEQIRKPVQYRF